MEMAKTVIRMQGIRKVYDNGIVANDNAFIEVNEGEIHALAGENGAGKSTLMKILFGLEQPTSGEIFLNDKEVKITSPFIANSLGIGMVHQNFKLINELTVAENIILGNEITHFGLIDKKATLEFVNKIAKEFGMEIDANEKVANLSIVQKQKVEILKVLARKAKIIILDEPTAVLTPQETQEFFTQLKLLREKGHTIVIITHKLNEIKQICDRITIMRSGKFVGMYQVKDITEEEISRLMVGRDVVRKVDKKQITPQDLVLKVQNVSKAAGEKKILDDVSFAVRGCEIVCICGVEGNGQRELVQIITGFERDYHGKIELNGIDIRSKSIRKLRELGENHIPEDRVGFGVDSLTSISENLISTSLNDVSRYGFIHQKRTLRLAEECIQKYQIKCKNPSQNVGMLSGGNMQKVVIARETKIPPKLLVADQPTRGVDIGAIEFIHKKLVEMRDAGTAILLISSDLAEVFSLSDRILVFYNGSIVANIHDVGSLTEEELGLYMLGLKRAVTDND
jgi:ABC-type uncharacterized transport system ATPase subunit